MKRFVICVLLRFVFLVAVFVAGVSAQVCDTVQDTLYSISATGPVTMNGAIRLTLGTFLSDGSFRIVQSVATIDVTNGTVNTCQPPGIYRADYTVRNTGGSPNSYTTYWYLPTNQGASPLKLTSAPQAVVNTANTTSKTSTITWVSGMNFSNVAPKASVVIGGVTYAVATVTGTNSLTVTGQTGTHSGVTFTDGPVERQLATGVIPTTIVGPPGPMGGTTWYSQTVTSGSASVVVTTAQHGFTNGNLIVMCGGIAECGSVNVADDGTVTVRPSWNGTLSIGGGATASVTFTNSTTCTMTTPQNGITKAVWASVYNTAGDQFAAGPWTHISHDTGIGGLQGSDEMIQISATTPLSGRCVFAN